MLTLTEMWLEYRVKVLPPNVSSIQERECRSAFMAGAISLFSEMNKVSEQDEDKACSDLDKWFEDACRTALKFKHQS